MFCFRLLGAFLKIHLVLGRQAIICIHPTEQCMQIDFGFSTNFNSKKVAFDCSGFFLLRNMPPLSPLLLLQPPMQTIQLRFFQNTPKDLLLSYSISCSSSTNTPSLSLALAGTNFNWNWCMPLYGLLSISYTPCGTGVLAIYTNTS